VSSITPGSFFSKPFADYRIYDFELLSKTNLEGYIYITELEMKQMLAQKTGTSRWRCWTIASTVNACVPMISKGGLEDAVFVNNAKNQTFGCGI